MFYSPKGKAPVSARKVYTCIGRNASPPSCYHYTIIACLSQQKTTLAA